MDIIEIEICNWEKYNPRSDRAHHSWLRLENSFFYNQDLFKMTDSQRLLFIFLLCEASRAGAGTVRIDLEFAAMIRKTTIAKISDDLQTLTSSGVLRLPSGNQVVTDRHTTNDTNETRRNERTNEVLPLAHKRSRPYVVQSEEAFRENLGEFIGPWVTLYSEEYVFREASKAFLWLKANPRKSKKSTKGWVAFFGGWFERGWDRTTTRGPSNAAEDDHRNLDWASLKEQAGF